jgi:hypothetical protein
MENMDQRDIKQGKVAVYQICICVKKLVQTFNAETWTPMNKESKIQAMNMKVLRQYWKVNKKEQN